MPKKYSCEEVQPLGLHNPKSLCIRTKEVKEYMEFPFEFFNPPQSEFLPYLEDDDSNIVVAAATSSGKTVIAELFAVRAIRQGKKALYIAPMKALANEKFYEWAKEKHPFNKYNIEILTGDYKLTEEKKKRLLSANIILLTPEMFNSKCRFFGKNEWLKNSVFIGDEIHLLGLENRGDALEVGLIQYFENSPNSRALFLSATLPNVNDLGVWLNHMTKRPSKVIVSSYRPCKLNTQFVTFMPGSSYDETEKRRMAKIVEYIVRYKSDPMLVFVGSKMFGNYLSKKLEWMGIDHRFHNADLDSETKIKTIKNEYGEDEEEVIYGRSDIERDFREGKFNVLIATSTMAWGINSSAKTVLQCHTKFGLTPMHPSNIIQAIGRAGRTGKSERGDAFIFCSAREKAVEEKRICSEYKVESTLKDPNLLMFHVLSYINDKKIKDENDFSRWYGKTLASIQEHEFDLRTCKMVLENLRTRMMVSCENDEYKTTILGRITSQMYMSPLDMSDWFVNFSKIPSIMPRKGLTEEEEKRINFKIAQCFAECYNWGMTWKIGEDGKRRKSSIGKNYITAAEKDAPEVSDICEIYGDESIKEFPHIKYTATIYRLLNGGEVSQTLNSYKMSISRDIERITTTLRQCDDQLGKKLKESGKTIGFGWGHHWDNLALRLKYGIRSSLVELVEIPGIGKIRAEKLESVGITTKQELLDPANINKCEKALGKKTYSKAISSISV